MVFDQDFEFDQLGGISGTEYYKSAEYRQLLQALDDKNLLKGSLKCSLLLANFFSYNQSIPGEIEAANKTITAAYDCFIDEDFPFYEQGCALRYELDKHLDHVRDLGYYASACMSGTMGYYYK